MTSEPVGNSPRTPATGIPGIPGNAHKTREADVPAREDVEKVVEGKVVVRKQPWYKRAARSMVADDVTNVGDYILADVILPAARTLILQIVSEGTSRVLFGPNRRAGLAGPQRVGMGGVGSLRTQYDRVGETQPRRIMGREARETHDFREIVLESMDESRDVIDGLFMQLNKYGSASVTDLYNLVGVTGSYADQRWGWYDLATADIRQVPGGYLLDLPRPEPLR